MSATTSIFPTTEIISFLESDPLEATELVVPGTTPVDDEWADVALPLELPVAVPLTFEPTTSSTTIGQVEILTTNHNLQNLCSLNLSLRAFRLQTTNNTRLICMITKAGNIRHVRGTSRFGTVHGTLRGCLSLCRGYYLKYGCGEQKEVHCCGPPERKSEGLWEVYKRVCQC